MRIRSIMLAGVSLAIASTALAANGTVHFRRTESFGARQAADAASRSPSSTSPV